MEPVNHWRPVTSEYQLEFMPVVQALPAPRKRRSRAEIAQEAALRAEATPLPVTCIQWSYFFRACAYFVLGSILLSYPSSTATAWVLAHSGILAPFKVTIAQAAPAINLLAESFFVLSIVSAIVGVMWLMRSSSVRWITMCYAGISLARTVLFFVTIKTATSAVLLSLHQKELLLTDAVVNLLIFSYVAFYSGIAEEPEQAG